MTCHPNWHSKYYSGYFSLLLACVPITLKAKSSQELVSYSCQVGVLTHLEPDILECKVKQTLRSTSTNKASGGDGIPVELFQTLKYDAVKVLHSICQQVWKTHQGPPGWKRSFQSQGRTMPKNTEITAQLHSFHMLAK